MKSCNDFIGGWQGGLVSNSDRFACAYGVKEHTPYFVAGETEREGACGSLLYYIITIVFHFVIDAKLNSTLVCKCGCMSGYQLT